MKHKAPGENLAETTAGRRKVAAKGKFLDKDETLLEFPDLCRWSAPSGHSPDSDGPSSAESSQALVDQWVRALAHGQKSPYSAAVYEADLAGSRHLEGPDGRTIRSRALGILREYRGFTQRRLADASGVNKATISSYERGRQEIGAQNLDQILRALGLSERAWEATLRHVEWLDWLAHRRERTAERGAPGPEVAARQGSERSPDDRDLHRWISRVAEAAGRERERTLESILELLLRSLARGGTVVESGSDDELGR